MIVHLDRSLFVWHTFAAGNKSWALRTLWDPVSFCTTSRTLSMHLLRTCERTKQGSALISLVSPAVEIQRQMNEYDSTTSIDR